jgi:hypothetical protein
MMPTVSDALEVRTLCSSQNLHLVVGGFFPRERLGLPEFQCCQMTDEPIRLVVGLRIEIGATSFQRTTCLNTLTKLSLAIRRIS